MNSTTNFTSCFSQLTYTAKLLMPYVVWLLTVSTCLSGFLLNFVITFVFIRQRKKLIKYWSDWLILNIAVGDVIESLLCIPMVYYNSLAYWCESLNKLHGLTDSSFTLLSFVNSCRSFGGMVSIYSMVWLSIERFRSTVLHSRSLEHIRATQVLGRQSIVFLIVFGYETTHYFLTSKVDSVYHVFLSAFFVAIIPVTITSLMYCGIAYKLLKDFHRYRSTRRRIISIQRHRTKKFLVLFIVTNFFCFLPFVVNALLDTSQSTNLYHLLSADLYSFVNFFIYWLINMVRCVCYALLLFTLSSKLKEHLESWLTMCALRRICSKINR